MAKVLLIESDCILGSDTRQILNLAGYSVDLHVELQAAMDSADANRPDIIILDLLLAGRSGVEFLYEFRSYPEWASVPVIIYGSLSREEFSETSIGFNHLNIAAYHYKQATSIAQSCESVQRILQPAVR